MRILYTLVFILVSDYLTLGQSGNKDTIATFMLMDEEFQIKYPTKWKLKLDENRYADIFGYDSIYGNQLSYSVQVKPIPKGYSVSIRKATKKIMSIIESPWGQESKEKFQVVQNKNVRINKKKFRYIEFQWEQNGKAYLGYRYFKLINRKLFILAGGKITATDKSASDFWKSLKIKKNQL